MQKIINVLPDALLIGGGVVLSYGAWLLHPAAGFIVGGLLMLGFGVLANRKAAESKAAE